MGYGTGYAGGYGADSTSDTPNQDATGYVYENVGFLAADAKEGTGYAYENVGRNPQAPEEGIGYVYEDVLKEPLQVYGNDVAFSVVPSDSPDAATWDLVFQGRSGADSLTIADVAGSQGAYSRTGTDEVSGTDVPTSYVRAPRSGSESVPPPTDTATGTLQRLFVRFGVEILPAPADYVIRYTRLAVQAQPGGTLPTLRTIRPNEARAATSPIRVWSSDVPVSQPVPYDHAQPVLVDFGGFGFTTGGIAVNLADADLEAVYAPWYAPEAAP